MMSDIKNTTLQCCQTFNHWINQYAPRTLAGRFLLVMFALVFTSQVMVNHLWERQMASDWEDVLAKSATSVALRTSATIEYFVTLPAEFRQVAINKLRYMGGARYFITLNSAFINQSYYKYSPAHQTVVNVFKTIFENADHINGQVQVAFSRSKTLKVLDNQTRLKDLPGHWGKENLMIGSLDLPVLVIQVELDNNQWLYLATLMPDSSIFVENTSPAPLQTTYLVWLMVLLALATLAIYLMVRPFEALSTAAKEFGQNLTPVTVQEQGCREYERTALAFNQMQKNIQHYMNDRRQLFSGISHDLKTPITRLRLRAELLDNEVDKKPFIDDLEHLEIMVKSALQMVSDTDIHENPQLVDLGKLLNDMTIAAQSLGQRVWLHNKDSFEITGKPLALKRCLENVIGNAIVYGPPANIYIHRSDDNVIITVRDSGPGIPEDMKDAVFKPYHRLPYGREKNPDGHGLGLITARHLAKIHGGRLHLNNHPEGGLELTLELPA